MKRVLLAGLLVTGLLGGCETHVIVEQPKPLDINVNFNGHIDLNLVIHDARQNLEDITGEKPSQVVSPADIGLPVTTTTQGAATGETGDDFTRDEGQYLVLFSTRRANPAGDGRTFPVATTDDMKKALKARNKEIGALWESKAIGESHTGLVVVKGTLTPAQQKLVNDENADRTALYAAEATEKKTTPDDVALGYYVARLGYAKKGAWYDKLNATTKAWEWKEWGS